MSSSYAFHLLIYTLTVFWPELSSIGNYFYYIVLLLMILCQFLKTYLAVKQYLTIFLQGKNWYLSFRYILPQHNDSMGFIFVN